MAIDPLSPIAPARVRVLVLPAGRIKKKRFLSLVHRLQQHDRVRLGDISPDGRRDQKMFSPLAFPNGSLLYHFSTSMPPPSHVQLTPFELFREPLMVLGVADALEYESSPRDELQKVAEQLSEQYPKILVSQLLVMDCTPEQQETWNLPSAICVPSLHASKTTTMNTIMCDISANFLSELATYATAVQALPSIQSPGAPTRPSDSRPHLDRSSSLRTTNSRPESPAGSPAPTSFDDMVESRSDSPKTASRDRKSVQPFASNSAQERAKNKGKARVGIVIGNLYMMAGRWNDAWRELVENTNKARTATDYLWYAKGLESIVVCMLLLIWNGFDFSIPAICNSGPDRSSSIISSAITKDGVPAIGQQEPAAARQAAVRVAKLLPDLVPMIISIYERTSSLAGEPMSPVAYSESVLRLSKLLAFIQNAGGELDSTILHKIASSTSRSLHQPKPNAGFAIGISKHAIADIALRAYPPFTAGVPLSDMVAIQSGIISVLSMLGLERKKSVIVKEMVTLLVPALVQARKVGAAEMGIHPAASLSAAIVAGDSTSELSDQQLGVGSLLRDLHSVYGARDRDHFDSKENEPSSFTQGDTLDVLINATIAVATQSADTKSFGSTNLKVDILRACIDFCEALPDLPGVVHFSALLLRVVGPQGTMNAYDHGRRVSLVTEEQLRLINNMARTTNAASKIGVPNVKALYWDDFLVRNVQWVDDTNSERLRERHKSDLLFDADKKPGRSPFLYNPFAKQIHKTEDKIIVVGEPSEVVVTLQNPYDFELRIEHLSLVTDGPSIEVDSHPFVLGPARLQDVIFKVRAKEEGQIRILGCSIQVSGCKDQIFPIYHSSWKASFPEKIKECGLSAGTSMSSTEQSRSSKGRSSKPILPEPFSVSAMAIHAQPHVVLEKLDLSESALMVLEGQRKSFQITLRNTSQSVAVDFLHVSFEDSLTSSIHTALAAKELTKPDMYGLELELSQNPTFAWTKAGDDQDLTIAPGEKAVFNITVLGKPGLAAAKIMFDYAYLGKPFSELEGRAFTRQVSVPIDITVNASVQLHRIDFTEFPADFAWKNQKQQVRGERPSSSRSSPRPAEKGSDRFRALLDRVGLESASEEHCLVSLDLRNAWPNPLTVSVQVRSSLIAEDETPTSDGWKRAYTVHEVIHPGHIARLVLLLPRLHIRNPYAQIPILSQQNQRQFVVSADGPISADVERTTRETFWFREEVLKYIRGSWEEKGSDRQGHIDLRGIRMSSRMIETLRLQDIDINMTCTSDDNTVSQISRNRFAVQTESLLTLKTTIHNRTAGPIHSILRLQPTLSNQSTPESALDISRRLIWSGLLQQPLPIIPAHGKVEAEIGLCALVTGEFDVSALVEETLVPNFEHLRVLGGDGQEDFEAGEEGLARKERRVWRGEMGCRLVVSESE